MFVPTHIRCSKSWKHVLNSYCFFIGCFFTLHQLEGMVDVRRWQFELEAARVRDHRELLSLGRRIESENAAINRELAQQGATIAEVLRVIHVRAPPLVHSRLTPNLPLPYSLHFAFAHARMTVTLSHRTSTLVYRMPTLPRGPSRSRCRSRSRWTRAFGLLLQG